MAATDRVRYDLEQRCQHWAEAGADPHGLMRHAQCPLEGVQVRLRCPAGRPDAVSAYCVEHGGAARARAAAELDWNYLAPESVGGAVDVEHAGCLCLQTPEAYVVLRQTPAEQGGTWLAWLGLGSLLTPVPNPEPRPVRLSPAGERRSPRGGRRHKRAASLAEHVERGAITRSFPTRAEAFAAADVAWSARVRARVAEIRAARGGTLEWGTPVEPLEDPIVVVLEQGDSRSAWDVAVTLPRRGRSGVAGLTGLRPSGECA